MNLTPLAASDPLPRPLGTRVVIREIRPVRELLFRGRRDRIASEGLHHGCPPFDLSTGLNPSHPAARWSPLHATHQIAFYSTANRRYVGPKTKTDALQP